MTRQFVDRYTSHSFFSCTFTQNQVCIFTAWLKTSHPMCLCSAHSYHLHAIHDVCLIVCWLRPRSVLLLFLSLSFTSSLRYPTCTLTSTSSPMSTASRELTTAPSHNEEYGTMAIYHPPTGYEPNVLDDFHYSETSVMIFQDESGDIDTEASYLCDAELDDETIGKALSSPLFIQERQEPADRRQAYHSYEESLLPSSVLFSHTRTEETRTRN